MFSGLGETVRTIVEKHKDEDIENEEEKIKKVFSSRKPTRYVLQTVPSGEIALELGADGIWLRFDCDCVDALPACQAQCCALIGTLVRPEELESGQIKENEVSYDAEMQAHVMARQSDGFCKCLDRSTRSCDIYDRRPLTCKDFHCTRGANQRGHKIPNSVARQRNI